jgi:hypothetical protein
MVYVIIYPNNAVKTCQHWQTQKSIKKEKFRLEGEILSLAAPKENLEIESCRMDELQIFPGLNTKERSSRN